MVSHDDDGDGDDYGDGDDDTPASGSCSSCCCARSCQEISDIRAAMFHVVQCLKDDMDTFLNAREYCNGGVKRASAQQQ